MWLAVLYCSAGFIYDIPVGNAEAISPILPFPANLALSGTGCRVSMHLFEWAIVLRQGAEERIGQTGFYETTTPQPPSQPLEIVRS